MSINIINTKNAPKAIGPYVQGIKFGNIVMTSGQIPINPNTGKIESQSLIYQVNQTLKNIKSIIEASGMKIINIVKTTIFTTDLKNFTEINLYYEKFFQKYSNHFPARSCVEVSNLPKNVKIEIEAVAFM